MTSYNEFLKRKEIKLECSGFKVELSDINDLLFDYQKDIVKWALKKGKAALFEGCGLGKTFQQLEWSRLVHEHTNKPILILAPLAVSVQTTEEAKKLNINVNICREQKDLINGINITNYEILDKFDTKELGGVVLDESSILKSYMGKVKQQIINSFFNTPYRLACTATPSPNDYMELCNHAEFLGVMTRNEMLAMFFIHDGGSTSKWRLKKHAVTEYWNWVSSWAVMMQSPQDLGYNGDKFILPGINIEQHTVITGLPIANTLTEQRQAAKATMKERVKIAANIVNNTDDYCVTWCNLNDESKMLKEYINNSVEVKGSDNNKSKEKVIKQFTNGEVKKLVTKPSIFGFGINMQQCCNMVFVGLNNSFEQYYQAVRRCYRFGQNRVVNVHIITSDCEGNIVENIKRKEQDFNDMLHGMIAATQEITKENLQSTMQCKAKYDAKIKMIIPEWVQEEIK